MPITKQIRGLIWKTIYSMARPPVQSVIERYLPMKKKCKSCIATVILTLSITLCFGKLAAAGDIETAGDVLRFVLPATAAGMTLGYRDGQGAIQLGESLAVTMAATYALKYGIDEKRPNGRSRSFPSNYASVSFSAAEFIRKRYGWEYGVPAYAAASFVAYSRVESNQHHPHDVIAGAAIGILSSYLFTKPYNGWHVSVEGDAKSVGL